MKNTNTSHRILFGALLIRLLMLAVILGLGERVSLGLLGSTDTNDDVRYLEIGQQYLKTASSIIDISAFQNAMDTIETGYFHSSFSELWYWIVCFLYYVLRSEFLVKLVNVLFAVASVKCIYDICYNEFGPKQAKLASSLYAFLPYPVIFSCFLYKDQFYTLITLLLIRRALKCARDINIKDIIIMALLVIVSMLTRTGLVVLVLGALIILIYKKGNYRMKSSSLIIILPFLAAITAYVIFLSSESIQRKLLAYVYEYTNDSPEATVSFFLIKNFWQIWKFPLALSFILSQPLMLSISSLNCWMNIAGVLNIVAIPIVIGNMLYLFSFHMKKSYLYWLTLGLYFVTIITSLGIVRHQFYLQPFMLMIFAVYYYRIKSKVLLISSSVFFSILLLSYWVIQL